MLVGLGVVEYVSGGVDISGHVDGCTQARVQHVCLAQLSSADSNVHLQVLVSPDEQLITAPYRLTDSHIQRNCAAFKAQQQGKSDSLHYSIGTAQKPF